MSDYRLLDIVIVCDPKRKFYQAGCKQKPGYMFIDSSPEGAIIRLIRWIEKDNEDAS